MLDDKEIREWGLKISEISKKVRYSTIPFYDNSSSKYPSLLLNGYNLEGQPERDELPNKELYFIPSYKMIFSLSENISSYFDETLNKLKNKEFNDLYMDTSFVSSNKKLVTPDIYNVDMVKEDHIVNNKKYVRYFFSKKDVSVFDLIKNFSIIERALKLSTREIVFKINDIVSTKIDKSIDYLIIDDLDYDKVSVVEIIDITNNLIEYGEIKSINISEICYSRTDRINNIIGDN